MTHFIKIYINVDVFDITGILNLYVNQVFLVFIIFLALRYIQYFGYTVYKQKWYVGVRYTDKLNIERYFSITVLPNADRPNPTNDSIIVQSQIST